MCTDREPEFYVLERILYDSMHKNYGELWNQLLIRPCYEKADTYRKMLEGKAHGIITFEGAICHQNKDETEDEFILRAACNGYNVSFVVDYVRTEDWNQYTVKVKDEVKDKEYLLPLPKKIVKGDKNLEKWA